MDNFSVLARNLSFLGTRPDSTICRYSNGFYHFLVLIRTVFRYSLGIFLFRELARILPFFRYSHGFYHFSLRTGTVFRYSHGFYLFRVLPRFYHFSRLARILPFSGTHRDSFLVLARILPFPGTRLDSTIFRDSHGFYHFPIHIWTVFPY